MFNCYNWLNSMTWIIKYTVNLHENDEWWQQLTNMSEQTEQIVVSEQ